MVDPIIIRNSGDAYISSAYPKKNFSNTRKLYVKSNNPDSRYAYLYFGQPFPAGATILSAKLVLRNGTVLSGPTTTVTVQRIKEKWSKNKITWNNRPDVEGASVSVTKSGNVPILTEWEFNITAMMQSVANGAKWYGVRFTANDGKGDWFFGSLASSVGRRPYIEIEYIEASTEPENLSPTSGGVVSTNKPTLSFDYFDRRGKSVVSAVQVQIATSSTGFGTPTWDSGEVPTTVAELDLAGTSYPGAASGSTVWWRARARNSAGQLSGWSAAASFVYRALTPIAFTNPISSLTDIRKNWVSSPNGNGLDRWSIVGATLSTVNGKIRATATSVGAKFLYWGWGNVNKYAVAAPGETWTLSAKVRVNAPHAGALYQAPLDSAGAQITAPSSGKSFTSSEASYSFTAPATPANTAFNSIAFGWNAAAIGDWIEIDEILFEKSGSVGSYFDGGFTPDSSGVYSWVGAENSSASVLRATAYVEDSSPPIEWTFGGTQVHRQILVRDPLNGSIVYDSGKMTSSVKDFTVPDKKLLYGKRYELEVRVWDNYLRMNNGGVPTFSSQKILFNVVGTTAVSPTTGLTATQQKPFHWIRLNWTRAAGAPDYYDIVMNGKVIEKVEGVDVHTGQNATYLSLHARPRRDDVWAVIPIVNGRSASNYQTVTTNVRVLSCILSEMDGSDPIVLLNYENSGSRSSIQAVHETLGDTPPVLITQAIRGKEGTITGVLSGAAIPGVDVFAEKERFERLREREGRSLMLTIIEDSMEVFIAKTDISPQADADGITYNVYFDYYQKDF